MVRPHGGKLVNRIINEKDKDKIVKDDFKKIEISRERAIELDNIAVGAFSPLEGFMTSDDFYSVIERGRLSNGLAWTIPITFDVNKNDIEKGEYVFLTLNDEVIALFEIDDIYKPNKEEWVKGVFGTTDKNHPGVRKVYQMKEYLAGGRITLINRPKHKFEKYHLTPLETRILFKEKGWRTIVGFQTRNAPHLGHEYVQKTALTFVDGLFINPVIGKKKAGDFKDEVIIDAYKTLIEKYYLKDTAIMAILPFEMRYAGPKEAIFHAIVRKNYGCTHFIVGRDHAGVGNYYGPYAAQEIFEEYPDLGITPLFFKSFFYCKKCRSVVNEKICPHDEKYHIKFSGTKIREMLMKGEKPGPELMRPEVVDTILKYKNPFVEGD